MKAHIIFSIAALATALSAQPYEPHAIWQREGAGDSSLYGSEILALGDQNDDGYNDWAVFALGNANDTYHGAQPGYLEFFHGGNPPDTVPYMVRTLNSTTEAALWNAYTVGDLNGDGHVDWIVVVQRNDGSFNNDHKIYFGGPGPHSQPDLTFTSLLWLIPIGDVNGDGYDDLQSGDYHRTFNYDGGNPFDTLPDWTRNAFIGEPFPGDANGDRFSDYLALSTDDNVDLYLGGEPPDTLPAYHWDEYISNPAILPDINGDGIGDLAFGVAGGAEIRFGGSTIHSTSDVFLHFPGCSPHMVASAGDFNHDGYHDVAMVSPFCDDSWYGKLAVHLGGSWLNPEPAFMIEGWTDPFNLIGIRTVVNAGDINGDGIDDLAIGANQDVAHAGWRGKVVIIAGDTSLHTGVDTHRPELPQNLQVSVYPNPFNSSATVELNLAVYSRQITLVVYNLLGQEVSSTKLLPVSGRVVYHYDASNLSTGIYILRVSCDDLQTTSKLIVLR